MAAATTASTPITPTQRRLLLAIARTNGHPDPAAWAAQVEQHYEEPADIVAGTEQEA